MMVPRGAVLHTVGVAGDTTMAAIRKYHVTPDDPKTQVVEGNGWRAEGYHFGIRKDGTVELGRDRRTAGAHTEGANDTLGICVYGDGDREPWTPAQDAAVLALLVALCRHHGWTADRVCGHREAPARFPGAKPTSKTCPGKLVDLDALRARLAVALAASQRAV